MAEFFALVSKAMHLKPQRQRLYKFGCITTLIAVVVLLGAFFDMSSRPRIESLGVVIFSEDANSIRASLKNRPGHWDIGMQLVEQPSAPVEATDVVLEIHLTAHSMFRYRAPEVGVRHATPIRASETALVYSGSLRSVATFKDVLHVLPVGGDDNPISFTLNFAATHSESEQTPSMVDALPDLQVSARLRLPAL